MEQFSSRPENNVETRPHRRHGQKTRVVSIAAYPPLDDHAKVNHIWNFLMNQDIDMVIALVVEICVSWTNYSKPTTCFELCWRLRSKS